MWRKAMVYLGLGDDAEYDEYDDGHRDDADRSGRDRTHAPPQRPAASSSVSTVSQVGPSSPPADEPSGIGAVRPIGSRGAEAMGASQTVNPSGAIPRPRPQVVRPIAVTPNAKPHLVAPTSFNQAQEVADKFKGNQPVVMNLQEGDRELSRRLIDFASGLCYGLGGQMERLANQVYLLTPSNVEVSAEERRRLHERGYDA
ncbi:MAG TPA: cell division protein SepF [Aquihabitans sp.]|jgi:cell division inhibitor SepF|nr:cell division protein SepF [Aquihabitans sp.]